MIVPSRNGFMVGAAATLLGEGDALQAWAERYVRQDGDLKWILGNFVEADQANSNGHIFPLGDLVSAQESIAHKSLNMMHRPHYIVGHYAGAQLRTAEGVEINPGNVQAAEASDTNPFIEALACMYHRLFPEEFFNIQRAHKDGSLFFSMEAIPETVSCPTCNVSAEFAGIESPNYCDHMQGATGPKILHKPHFAGGAIIIPPVQPGWKRADVTAISKLMVPEGVDELVRAQLEEEAPHLDIDEWNALMASVLELASQPSYTISTASGTTASTAVTWEVVENKARQYGIARDVSTKEREKLAKKGNAMPDGSFPIANVADLRNAIQAVGRAKDPAAAKAHIKRAAKRLGREDLIPEGW